MCIIFLAWIFNKQAWSNARYGKANHKVITIGANNQAWGNARYGKARQGIARQGEGKDQ